MPLIDPDATHDHFPLFEAGDCVTSYMLKNSLFHVLRQSKTDGLMVELDNQSTNNAIVNMSVRLLQFLDCSLLQRKLPVYFLPNREDIFRFDVLEVYDSNKADTLIVFHCARRRAFVKIMLHMLRH